MFHRFGSINLFVGNFPMRELQTAKIHSNYFKKFDWTVADFMPLRRKCNIMNPEKWCVCKV